MNYKEYGKDNKDVIILLHGGGLSWWNYRSEALLLRKNYHVIIPILDGHSGSDRSFTSIRDNAEEIIAFIDENYNGHVLFIGGLSLGAQILLEILSIRNDICDYSIIESGLVVPSKLTYKLIEPSVKYSYGLIKKKWFSLLQFRYLRIKSELFNEYYTDTCAISKEDMILFMKENSMYQINESLKNATAKVKIIIGNKENFSIKKSAALISKYINNSSLLIVPLLYHGEFSLNKPEKYVDEVLSLINSNK